MPRAQPRIFGYPYTHAVLIYIDRNGELGLDASPSMARYAGDIFTQDVFERFMKTASMESQSDQRYPGMPEPVSGQNVPAAHTVPTIETNNPGGLEDDTRTQSRCSSNPVQIYPASLYRPSLSRSTEFVSCERQSQQKKRKKRSSTNRLSVGNHGSAITDGSVSPGPAIRQAVLDVGNEALLRRYYNKAFDAFQQVNCKTIGKAFVKVVEPRKQVSHPYNGRVGPFQRVDPELTKPKWWPAGVTHKEPDHLLKAERIRLLVHILCNLRESHDITVDKLREASQSLRTEISPPERLEVLDEVFRVREMEELYLNGEIDAGTVITVAQVHIPEAAIEIPEHGQGTRRSTEDAPGRIASIKTETPSTSEEGHRSPDTDKLETPSICISGSSNAKEGHEVPCLKGSNWPRLNQPTQDLCFRAPPAPSHHQSGSGKSTQTSAPQLCPQAPSLSVMHQTRASLNNSAPKEINPIEPVPAGVTDYFPHQPVASSTSLSSTDSEPWSHLYYSPMSYPYDYDFSPYDAGSFT